MSTKEAYKQKIEAELELAQAKLAEFKAQAKSSAAVARIKLKLPYDTAKLYIYTNGLKAINPFGQEIFHNFMRSLNGQSAKIVFTGNHASQLFPENSLPPS